MSFTFQFPKLSYIFSRLCKRFTHHCIKIEKIIVFTSTRRSSALDRTTGLQWAHPCLADRVHGDYSCKRRPNYGFCLWSKLLGSTNESSKIMQINYFESIRVNTQINWTSNICIPYTSRNRIANRDMGERYLSHSFHA